MSNRRLQRLRYSTNLGRRRFVKSLRRKGRKINKSPIGPIEYNEVIKFLAKTFKLEKCKKNRQPSGEKTIKIPRTFSLVENPRGSYPIIEELLSTLYCHNYETILIDYKQCELLDLDAQIYLDILLKYFIDYVSRSKKRGNSSIVKEINLVNTNHGNVKKVLFSIGSPNIINKVDIKFKDVVKYPLCIGSSTFADSSGQKEVDTTDLVDYVIECLQRLNKKLTTDSRRDLCDVIGEVLINAEEHSTTNYRFSIGYFHDIQNNETHSGVFNLVIFNFGKTIYQKFKDPKCPTKHIVKRMEELSALYTKSGFFQLKEFEEETLWTLYSLQEGVTSKVNFKKRGNGSIRFIESFFNLKGDSLYDKGLSKLTILSGNTKILFDGTYGIKEKIKGSHTYKVMTFNKEGEIDKKPDKKFVSQTDYYFPGTMISAKIHLTEQDFIKNGKSN
jgi:hypothetical protein